MRQLIRVKPNIINTNELMMVFAQNRTIFSSIYEAIEFIDYCAKLTLQLYDNEKTIKEFANDLLFEESLIFQTFTMQLRFDVAKAIAISKVSEYKNISMNKFKSMNVEFDNIHNVADSYALNETPIILIPYNFCGKDYLVIDGNHRLSSKTKCQCKSINIAILSIEHTISLFKSDFEKSIYLFIQDGLYLTKVLQKTIAKFNRDECFIEKAFPARQ